MVRLTPPRPPTPFSVKPKPSWIGGSSKVMMSRSEKPLRAVGQLGVEHADDLHADDVREGHGEDAGVLALGGSKRDVPAAGDQAGVDRPARARDGGLNASSRSAGPRLPPLGGKLSVASEPEPVDRRRDRSERDAESRGHLQRQPAACQAATRWSIESVTGPRSTWSGMSISSWPPPLIVQAVSGSTMPSRSERGLRIHAGQDGGKEAVAFGGVDHDLAAGDAGRR